MKNKRPDYKSEWKPFSMNKAFWDEVLTGRTIKNLEWDDKGIKALVLDNGERVLPHETGRFAIVQDV